MGKQMIFYATPTDLEHILCEIHHNNIIVLDEFGSVLNPAEILDKCEACFAGNLYGCNMYLTLDGLHISIQSEKENRRIDPIKSEVIVFHPCTQLTKYLLDTSSVDNYFKKGDYIVIDDTAKYNKMMVEFSKNPVYKINPAYIKYGFNHASFWLTPTYYDEFGNKVKKSSMIRSVYSFLQKYIRRNYQLSVDHFGYIGTDAYAHYLSGDFVPCSGQTRIQFGDKGSVLLSHPQNPNSP